MCKAGFAGDDAPRAVFRKSDLSHTNTPPKFPFSDEDLLSLEGSFQAS